MEKKHKNSIFFKLILLLIILVILSFVLTSTYSKYITQTNNHTSFDISKWHILLNDLDISENQTFTNTIKLEPVKNQNIAENVIVPTSQATFDMKLESTGTELPFTYEIKVSEGDVDTVSTYTTEFVQSWLDGTNYTYEIYFNLDYSYLEEPIWYYWQNTVAPWDSGFYYKEPEITIVLPEGFSCAPSYLGNTLRYSIEGNVVKFVPQWYSWNTSTETNIPLPSNPNITMSQFSDNTLRQQLHLTYNKQIDIEWENFWNSVSADGKPVLKKNLPDYRITSYSINNEPIILVPANTSIITGTVNPAKDADGNFTGAEVINNFKFYVEWYDGNDNILDNKGDVAASKAESAFGIIPIEVKVTQIQ